MAKIEIHELCKYFGDVKAIDNLNLSIEDGEFVTLLGPSGCGKTTTLLCLAGLEEPTSGMIKFDDQVVNDLSPRDRNVAVVFQDYALYPHMSVFNNMAFGLKQRKVKKDAVNDAVARTAQALGIDVLLDRKPGQLSGGQRQRVALGRAMVRNPIAFLMDEPLSNLDAALRVKTRTELKGLQKRLGVTTVYVTHDQEEAMVVSDRLAILRDGVLQQYATSNEVYNQPANIYVAGFIGSPRMNFIEGNLVSESSGNLSFRAGDILIGDLPNDLRDQLSEGVTKTILGVRPEGIKIATRGEAADLWCKITMLEPTGAITYVDLSIDNISLKASIDPDIELNIDDSIGIALVKEKLYFFDVDTGVSIL